MEQFLSKFSFRPELAGYIGVEREFFLVDPESGDPVPRSAEFLRRVRGDQSWTYELSACQVEHRTSPCGDRKVLRAELDRGVATGREITDDMGLELSAMSVAPMDMPLDVYPDPRYLKISAGLPEKVLRAACVVAGTHIHYGVRDLDHAIRVHNRLTAHLDELTDLGDKLNRARIRIYKVMAPVYQMMRYDSREHLFETAQLQGFEENPRNCWHFVRISVHGTVEVRVFGASDDADDVIAWAHRVFTIARG
jgi:gamma-glutamyl:cysteine ligase YbdK (ATP-grasp superfamily)